MLRHFAALLLLSVPGIWRPMPLAAASAYISGKVMISETNAPASDATLSLYKIDDLTTAVNVTQTLVNGSFLMKAPAAGSYRLTIQGPNFSQLDQTLTVSATGLSAGILHVNHLPFISIKLIGVDGKPINEGAVGIWLVLSGPDTAQNNGGWRGGRGGGFGGPMELTQPIGRDGRVEITLPEGAQDGVTGVLARVRCAGIGCGQVQTDHWPKEPLTARLQPGTTLQGLVLDDNGKPLAGAAITVTPVLGIPGQARGRGRRRNPMVTTGTDGRFEVPTLYPGEYLVRARSDNGSPSVDRVQLKGPKTMMTLRPGGAPVSPAPAQTK